MRLIDADALMKDIIKRFGCKPYIEVGNKSEYIHNIIDEQPTAYNPDKVVAELDKASFLMPPREKGHYADNGLFLEEAIDIARKGGVK